ncbi:unnamed protein product, partial [Meganyctiphanes norvegica]
MAEDRLNDMNAVLQSMQKALGCNICLDLLDKPLTTKCGHSFCAYCIDQCFTKGQRGVQCPLCLSQVTRRSLGKNEKITSLVIAVREIISSIKKDCCFEITPSKYRPRPRPALEVSPEDNDSENEENDEPRRGTRKRGIPNHYQPQLEMPRPRRGPKHKVLSIQGGQELQLHTSYNSNNSIAAGKKTGSSRESYAYKYEENLDENSAYVDYVSQEHDYYSPSKRQEPVEVTGIIANKGKGKQTENKGKQRKVVESRAKAKQRETVEDESQEHLSEKLGREAPNKKVEKWLNQSREIGFRIGESQSQSQSVPSEGSEASDEEIKESFQNSKVKIKGVGKVQNPGPSILNLVKKNQKQVIYSNGAASSSNGDMKNQSIRKFLKAKLEDFSDSKNEDTNIKEESMSSEDTCMFKPSQKAPLKEKEQSKRGRGGKVRGGAALGRTRARGNIRTSVASQRSMNAQADHARIKEVIVDTSTPKAKHLKCPKNDIDISVIDPNIIEENIGTSGMVQNNEDLDMYLSISDSCLNRSDKVSGDSKIQSKKRSLKHGNSDDDDNDEDYEPSRKSVKTKRIGEKIEEQCTNVCNQPKSRLRNRVTKSKEDAEAISYALEELDKYHINDKIDNKRHEKRKAKNISMTDQTINSTNQNRSEILSKSLDHHMPPPKNVPVKGRNVKNNIEKDTNASESSRDSSWAIKRAFGSLASEVCNTPNDVDSVVESSGLLKTTGSKGNVRFSAQTRLMEPRKVEARAVNIKDTKSPGWSHIVGAKKDLKNRHNILNIT